jgi:hypothetical protein
MTDPMIAYTILAGVIALTVALAISALSHRGR